MIPVKGWFPVDSELVVAMTSALGAIRRRLMWSAFAVLASTILVYAFSSSILAVLQAQQDQVKQLIFVSPTEAFIIRMKLALVGGIVISLPLLLWQVWDLLTRRFTQLSRKAGLILIPLAYALFLTGAAFAYSFILPTAFRFFLGFADEALQPMLTLDSYVTFVLTLVFPVGIVFQWPLLVLFLARLGILRSRMLSSRRRYAILAIFVVAALVTPGPDIFSQLILALPMLALYEVGIWVAWLAGRKQTMSTKGI